MFVTMVDVRVKPDHIDDFIAATKRNHEGSIQEVGNLRFDVCQLDSDPTRFVLYEAYVSEEAAAAHKETAHYQSWKDAVANWMAEPRKGVRYTGLFPAIDRDDS
jgi:autoinducer 2-degrading protein